ncbi:MAG: dicarboxylate/amino acid:cation symporter [Candidatus Improbicoccus devescovinae]|nr:MAG: dicarboxylate/amino acid:cation symporter [Candidatus Improbicoccus devescovinae]
MLTNIFKKYKLFLFIILAIILGILVGSMKHATVLIDSCVLLSSVLGKIISFFVPLIVVAFVTQGIVSLEKSSGRILGITICISYIFMISAGILAFFVGKNIFVNFFDPGKILSLSLNTARENIFSSLPKIEVAPLFEIIPAMIISFALGIGLNLTGGVYFKKIIAEFYKIIELIVRKLLVSILPFYVFGTFVGLASSGNFLIVMSMFYKVFITIILLHWFCLFFQFCIAGVIAKQNPLKLIKNIFPVYLTGMATQSSVATIPISMQAAHKLSLSEAVINFVVPFCSTVHLTGSIISITSCSIAVMILNNIKINFPTMFMFIIALGVMMVAAPGVPCGAILAASSLLGSFLGFDSSMIALMIALHVCQDGFGTACNVCGDNAIAVIINKIYKKKC